jgi:ribosomal protein S18 acetylase RimI-like enzyme
LDAFGSWIETGNMPQTADDTAITISEYAGDPAEAEAFRTLNEAWIVALFTLEDADREILEDPDGHILAHGGTLLLAKESADVIGCLAVVPTGPEAVELAKMTVSERARGRGVARRLIDEALAVARASGARLVTLETNHVLVPAIRLYESAGFRHTDPARRLPSEFARADVAMELVLS